MFLGMSDWMVAFAFAANVAVVIFCVIYGAVNYNKGDDTAMTGTAEETGKE